MSLDTQKLVMLIKQAAVDAVNAKDPMSLKIGEVVSVSPLGIRINQKITIPASELLLTNAVRDYTVYATVDHATESAEGGDGEAAFAPHSHAYRGKKKFIVHLGLKVGEKVILLRCDGGQKFIVLDRLEAPNG